jgi:malonyl-CoA O-methyltransferase
MPDDLSTVRDGYDRWARVYDHDANPLLALEEPAVHAALGDVRGRTVLDLGCGTGRHSLWLFAERYPRAARYVGWPMVVVMGMTRP